MSRLPLVYFIGLLFVSHYVLSAVPSCLPDMFQCADKQCIQAAWRCDREDDCKDGSDERNCTVPSCLPDMFQCADKQCIHGKWRCDGENDCNDGSDEHNCTAKTCTHDEFQCKDKTCIKLTWKCDGDIDCNDESDEEPEICSSGMKIRACNEREFQCEPGVCIHKSWECDGDMDCNNKADEGNQCHYNCTDTEIVCANLGCLPITHRCDGQEQCPDGSDELNCNVSNGTTTLPPCGNTGKMINGHCACSTGLTWSNEKRECVDVDECRRRCSQTCVNTAGSVTCECIKGYHLVNKTSCRADGERPWLYFTNRRSIRRVRTDGSGLELILDDIRCVGIDIDHHDGLLFYTDISTDTINRVSLKESKAAPKSIFDRLDAFSADGIAVDWLYRHVYWTDTGVDEIRVATYDGQYTRSLIDTGLDEPRSIALHPQQGYMYWTDWGTDAKIERSGMDGSSRQVIVSSQDQLGWPNGLTVDLVKESLYWVDAKLRRIMTSALDGSDVTILIDDQDVVQHPFSIAVFEDYLYWSDWKTDSIKRADKLTGENLMTILVTEVMDLKVSHVVKQAKDFEDTADSLCATALCDQLCLPKALANKDDTHIVGCFCTDDYSLAADNKTCVKTSDILTTTQGAPTIGTRSQTLTDITTVQGTDATTSELPTHTPSTPSIPLTSSSQSVVSSTPVFDTTSFLTATPYTADESEWWLYYSHKETLERIKPDGTQQETILENINCVALDIDYEEGLLFYTDHRADAIERVSIREPNAAPTPIYKGSRDMTAYGIAVDWLYKHIYWTDADFDEIMVATYEGQYARTLIDTDLVEPRAIVLFPELGYDTSICEHTSSGWGCQNTNGITVHDVRYMYWDDWDKNGAKIERSGMDGTNRQVIVSGEDGLVTPNGLSIDYINKRLYWVDARLDTITSSELDGSGISVIVNTEMAAIRHPFGISVHGNTVYWTDWQTRTIQSMNRETDQIITIASSHSSSLFMDVKVVHPMKQSQEFKDQAVRLCSVSNCQQLCLPKALSEENGTQEVGCFCANGYSQTEDNKTCAKTVTDQPIGKPEETPLLYFVTMATVHRMSMDGSSKEKYLSGIDCVGIDIDYEDGLLFCNDIIKDEMFRIPISTAQTTPTLIYKLDEKSSSDGLAVDWLYKHIYWTDDGLDEIKMVTYDGQYAKTLINTNLDRPRAIAVHPEQGYMYWTDWGEDAKIERCGMDGNNRQVIVTKEDSLGWPNGLTIDYAEDRLYWVDARLDMIMSAWLDGSNKRIVLNEKTEISHPFSIAVFEGYLYWNDWTFNSIKRMDKITGENITTIANEITNLKDMAVSYPDVQSKAFKETANALCATAQCDQLCLPKALTTQHDRQVGCYCSDGYDLAGDSKTCFRTSDPSTAHTTTLSSSTTPLHYLTLPASAAPSSTVGPVTSFGTVLPSLASSSTRVSIGTTRTSDPCSLKSCPEHSRCRNTHLFLDYVVATCVCNTGFVWNVGKQRCVDRDECQDRSTCSHICINNIGSFECECKAGYTLEQNGFCNADGGPEWLYMANGRDIRRLHYNSGYEQIIWDGTNYSRSLDYDFKEGRLFFTDIGGIYSAILPKGRQTIQETQRIVTEEGRAPRSVTVDWVFKRVYWINSLNKRLESANYNGEHVRTLIDTDLDDPRHIVIAPEHGFLYWSDCGKNPHIGRIGLDGSNREMLRTQADGLVCADALTIDYVDARLYWMDGGRSTIESVDLKGRDYLIVAMDPGTIDGPRSVTVFEDTVYWIDGNTNTLSSVDKRTGQMGGARGLKALHVTDVKVYHAKRQSVEFQSRFKALCSDAECQHVCIPASNIDVKIAAGVMCTCSDNFELNADGKQCSNRASTDFVDV